MIKNKTRNVIISENEIVCSSLWSQGRGLMFRRKQNLIMDLANVRKIKLHNFFVFYSIDVLLVDVNMRVVEIKKGFKPFTFWNSNEKAKYCVELSNSSNYKVGDYLEFRIA